MGFQLDSFHKSLSICLTFATVVSILTLTLLSPKKSNLIRDDRNVVFNEYRYLFLVGPTISIPFTLDYIFDSYISRENRYLQKGAYARRLILLMVTVPNIVIFALLSVPGFYLKSDYLFFIMQLQSIWLLVSILSYSFSFTKSGQSSSNLLVLISLSGCIAISLDHGLSRINNKICFIISDLLYCISLVCLFQLIFYICHHFYKSSGSNSFLECIFLFLRLDEDWHCHITSLFAILMLLTGLLINTNQLSKYDFINDNNDNNNYYRTSYPSQHRALQSVASGEGNIRGKFSLYLLVYIMFMTVAAVSILMLQGRMVRQELLNYKAGLEFKKRFLRTTSHEIRTPLNTVSLGLQLLRKEMMLRGYANPAVMDIVTDIQESARITLGIVDDLLTHDKIQEGILHLEVIPVPIFELVEKSARLFTVQARELGVNLVIDGGMVTDIDCVFVRGDPFKLNQVIRNLVSNALKFTPRGGTVEIKFIQAKRLSTTKQGGKSTRDAPTKEGKASERAVSGRVDCSVHGDRWHPLPEQPCEEGGQQDHSDEKSESTDHKSHLAPRILDSVAAAGHTVDGNTEGGAGSGNESGGPGTRNESASLVDIVEALRRASDMAESARASVASGRSNGPPANSNGIGNGHGLTFRQDTPPNDLHREGSTAVATPVTASLAAPTQSLSLPLSADQPSGADYGRPRGHISGVLSTLRTMELEEAVQSPPPVQMGKLSTIHSSPPNSQDHSKDTNAGVNRGSSSWPYVGYIMSRFERVFQGSPRIHGDEEEEETIIIQVTDSGAGISEENQKRLFKEIIQFHPGKLQGGKGSGLGLMITKGIMDLHKGKISVYSPGESHGTTFTIELPAYRDEPIITPASPGQQSIPAASTAAAVTRSPAARTNGMARPSRRRSTWRYWLTDDMKTDGEGEAAPMTGSDNLPNQQLRHQTNIRDNPSSAHGSPTGEALMMLASVSRHSSISRPSFQSTLSTRPSLRSSISSKQSVMASIMHAKHAHMHPHSHSHSPYSSVKSGSKSSSDHHVDFVEHPDLKRPLTVLVVDDSRMNRKMVYRVLEGHCQTILDAEDGLQAVELIKQSLQPDQPTIHLVFMDAQMPNMDGLTATREIRGLGYGGMIVGLTGNVGDAELDSFRRSGVNEVLCKPVDAKELFRVVSVCDPKPPEKAAEQQEDSGGEQSTQTEPAAKSATD